MKRVAIGAAIVVLVIGVAGVAWALLGGSVTSPDISIGRATGTGSTSCQTQAVNFDVPPPTWDSTLGDYAVTTVDYAGIESACVSLTTADLLLTITPSGGSTVLATASATDMSASSGTLTLSTAISFDDASTGSYEYLVKDQ